MANALKEVIEDITKNVNTSGGGKMKIKNLYRKGWFVKVGEAFVSELSEAAVRVFAYLAYVPLVIGEISVFSPNDFQMVPTNNFEQ